MNLPASTYRVQLNKTFTFDDLKKIIPYLNDLGITTIYAAPVLKATPDSMHGYDVTDPHQLNPEIGSQEQWNELAALLRQYEMTWLQDIVPNHMAFATQNGRLMDVLERGPNSPYCHYFDIDWDHHNPRLKGKLMVPFLGKPLDECIRDNELSLQFSPDGFFLRYFETQYPLSLTGYESLLEYFRVHHDSREWKDGLQQLIEEAKVEPTIERWTTLRQAWITQCNEDAQLRNAVNEWALSFSSPQKLIELINSQYYQLEFWKTSEREINYRRFFTVNSLICLRMESEHVFKEYHVFLHALYLAGLIHGLRIDHIDGLNDPSAYIRNLRRLFGYDCYIIAEKILESKEDIPEHWSLEGTSGYEFLSVTNQLFTDRQGASDLVKFYNTLVPDQPDYGSLVIQNKKLILEDHMGGELQNLVHYFFQLGLEGYLIRSDVERSLSTLLTSWPVYRIYPEKIPLKGADLELLKEALAHARSLNLTLEHAFDYLERLFTLSDPAHPKATNVILFLKRMMQFTGPITAKGVEDTTFFIYNPLISHDEVGDAPSTLGMSVRNFHAQMRKRMTTSAQSLNATATHDTKRGEDARIRLNLLSEMPEEWITHVQLWRRLNSSLVRVDAAGQRAPSVNDEYFIYQSMMGGFPDDMQVSDDWISRLQEYIVKVVREAKVVSSWSDPNEDYENACKDFIHRTLAEHRPFLDDFLPFAKKVANESTMYSMGQLLLKITAPGIPDIYQGCELYDLSYVDPDNRRPVNYQTRQAMLSEIKRQEEVGFDAVDDWLKSNYVRGGGKLFTGYKMLNFRKNHRRLFEEGEYIPIEVSGSILCFCRKWQHQRLVVVIPLGTTRKNQSRHNLPDLVISLPQDFPKEWTNIFTSEVCISTSGFPLGKLIEKFPLVALFAEEKS